MKKIIALFGLFFSASSFAATGVDPSSRLFDVFKNPKMACSLKVVNQAITLPREVRVAHFGQITVVGNRVIPGTLPIGFKFPISEFSAASAWNDRSDGVIHFYDFSKQRPLDAIYVHHAYVGYRDRPSEPYPNDDLDWEKEQMQIQTLTVGDLEKAAIGLAGVPTLEIDCSLRP